MEITESLTLNKCFVRRKVVKETPEERVRQRVVELMIHKLDYPLPYIAVEKELGQLPHITLPRSKLPKRRFDIIAFAKDIHPKHSLCPLLLIECKAVALTPRVANQVVGYNDYVQAPFVAVANEERILTGSYDKEAGIFRFAEGLPSYPQLLEALTTQVPEKWWALSSPF